MPLKVVTYNIQAAIGTRAYRQYITRINRQVFNSKAKLKTLKSIAAFASDFDVAALQEVDLGGRRSGFKCQVDHLLSLSDFKYMSMQENRIVGNISRHGNAILSKYPQADVCDLKLPGKHTGRGAIMARIEAPKPFHVINVHLSLGEADQIMQIEYLVEQAPRHVPLMIMGDFNCAASSRPLRLLSNSLNMIPVTTAEDKTYPSWKPRKGFDHMLVSDHFRVMEKVVNDVVYSDHRPVSAELRI
ncbi:endonuclease/exonuclease/phosphatase family protein [Hellea balneolensis]|uniref:endonuclease/exonuclease/phosphatase family protein n=1 Tax=Hellea balneolensis TaxID=287478 RepID=UPI0004024911|nr:endonuclease/exonuclease/phosphatase family protein [Hellea balneolensis]